MIEGGNRTLNLSLIGFFVVLVLAWFCYRPAFTGAFQLDDVSNLEGLALVEDLSSATDFILSGTAGPLGRPISLLTFALQAEHWEQGASAFLKINVLIHLINALLIAGCLYQLSRLQAIERNRAVMVAAAAASMWVLMPLLATSSLLAVQRMTTLSALFALLGLGGYLFARGRIDVSPNRALIGMSISIFLGTLLATLSKESGLLLPAYILVLEATLLKSPVAVSTRQWRLWQAVLLLLPTLVVVAYLTTHIVYPDWVVARRGFGVGERLLTEAQLLWLYLYKALVGFPAQLGIYQTPPSVSRSILEPLAFFATVSWLALAAASIFWRRRYPLFALAVLWYLTGHIIESSVVPLELYFEHRNYLPVIGLLYALSSLLLLGATQLHRAGAAMVVLFVLISAYFLYSLASLSGEPSSASRYWAHKYPDSVRAVTTMATYQLAEEGSLRTLSTIDRFVIEQPQFGYLRIHELNLRCITMPEQDHELVLEQLRRELPNVDATLTAGTMLSQLFDTVMSGNCNGVDIDSVVELAQILQRNPRYALVPGYNQFHHKLLAAIARQQGDHAATIDHLEEAIAYRPSEELHMMMVTALAGAGDFKGADDFINNAMLEKPVNPLKAISWQRNLEGLRAYILELEKQILRDQAEEITQGTETDTE